MPRRDISGLQTLFSESGAGRGVPRTRAMSRSSGTRRMRSPARNPSRRRPAVQPARQFIRTEAVLFARGSEGVEQGFIVRRKDGPVPVFQAVRQHAEQIRRFHIEGAGEKDEPRGTRKFLPCSMRLTQRLSLRIFLASAYCVRPRFRRSPTTISPNDTFFSSIRCLIHGPCNFDR